MEYLVLVGFLLVIGLSFTALIYVQYNESVVNYEETNLINTISENVVNLGRWEVDTKIKEIPIIIPRNTKYINFSDGSIVIERDDGSKYYVTTNYRIKGELPVVKGESTLTLIRGDQDYIYVNQVQDYLEITSYFPSMVDNSSAFLSVVTNKDSTCKFDFNDTDYDLMSFTMNNDLTIHDYFLDNLSKGDNFFYVRCKRFNDTMNSSYVVKIAYGATCKFVSTDYNLLDIGFSSVSYDLSNETHVFNFNLTNNETISTCQYGNGKYYALPNSTCIIESKDYHIDYPANFITHSFFEEKPLKTDIRYTIILDSTDFIEIENNESLKISKDNYKFRINIRLVNYDNVSANLSENYNVTLENRLTYFVYNKVMSSPDYQNYLSNNMKNMSKTSVYIDSNITNPRYVSFYLLKNTLINNFSIKTNVNKSLANSTLDVFGDRKYEINMPQGSSGIYEAKDASIFSKFDDTYCVDFCNEPFKKVFINQTNFVNYADLEKTTAMITNDSINFTSRKFNDSNTSKMLFFDSEKTAIFGYFKIPYNAVILNISFDIDGSFNYTCYQESANVSTSCGGLNSGIYYGGSTPDWKDTDWNTSTSVSGGSERVSVLYKKPIGATNNSMWAMKSNWYNSNMSIPQACWNYSDNNITMSIFRVGYGTTDSAQCLASTGYVGIVSSGISSHLLFEEGMTWNLNRSAVDQGVIVFNDTWFELGNIDGIREWNYSNVYLTKQRYVINTTSANDFLKTCAPNNKGFCMMPLNFHTTTGSVINISNITIIYNYIVNETRNVTSNKSIKIFLDDYSSEYIIKKIYTNLTEIGLNYSQKTLTGTNITYYVSKDCINYQELTNNTISSLRSSEYCIKSVLSTNNLNNTPEIYNIDIFTKDNDNCNFTNKYCLIPIKIESNLYNEAKINLTPTKSYINSTTDAGVGVNTAIIGTDNSSIKYNDCNVRNDIEQYIYGFDQSACHYFYAERGHINSFLTNYTCDFYDKEMRAKLYDEQDNLLYTSNNTVMICNYTKPYLANISNFDWVVKPGNVYKVCFENGWDNGYVTTKSVAKQIRITPNNPTISNDLICNYTYFDHYNYSKTGEFFKWYKNNALLSGQNNQTLLKSNFLNNDNITCSVKVNSSRYQKINNFNNSEFSKISYHTTQTVGYIKIPKTSLIFNVSFDVKGNYNYSCYQETANQTSNCGGLPGGIYAGGADPLWRDGNITTYTTVGGGSEKVYVTYQKPFGATNLTKWYYVGSAGNGNFTIPTSCWYDNGSSVKFQSGRRGFGPTQYLECLFNATWVQFGAAMGYSVNEEGMWWNINELLNYSNSTTSWFELGNLDGIKEWTYNDLLNTTQKVFFNGDKLNAYFKNCTADVNGYCYMPLIFYSNTSVEINVSNITINYYNFGDLSTIDMNIPITFNDSTTIKNLTFTNNETKLVGYLKINKSLEVAHISFNASNNFSGTNCYQESANITNQTGKDGMCELNYNGSYVFTAGYNDVDVYINYTKPKSAQKTSLWTVKHGKSTLAAYNITIPQNCWDNNQKTLSFKMHGDWSSYPSSSVYCYNKTGWQLLGNPQTAGGGSITMTTSTENNFMDGNWNTYIQRGMSKYYIEATDSYNARLYEDAMNWNIAGNIWVEIGDVDGVKELNSTGDVLNNYVLIDADSVNKYLLNCTADINGFCDVPITMYSNYSGNIDMSNFNVVYHEYNKTYDYDWRNSSVVTIGTPKPITPITYCSKTDLTNWTTQIYYSQYIFSSTLISNVLSLNTLYPLTSIQLNETLTQGTSIKYYYDTNNNNWTETKPFEDFNYKNNTIRVKVVLSTNHISNTPVIENLRVVQKKGSGSDMNVFNLTLNGDGCK